MKLTNATRYTLHALTHLARHGDGRMLPSGVIAEAEYAPLAQYVRELCRHPPVVETAEAR